MFLSVYLPKMQGWQWYRAVILTNPNRPTGKTWCGTDVLIYVVLDATVQLIHGYLNIISHKLEIIHHFT